MSADGVITFAGIGDEAGESLSEQIEAHQRLGWSTIELRNVDGEPLADLSDAAFDRLAERIERAGLRVVCVDSRIANWARPITGDFELDLTELGKLEKRCAALGTRYVRVMSYPNDGLHDVEWGARVRVRMRMLANRAEAAGLVLLHENCAGWAGTDARLARRLIEDTDSPALRLLFDIGNGIAYGYEAYDMLVALLPWVEHVHVKDARSENGEAVYTLPGEGDCRVSDCLRLLLDSGYTGTLTMEPHLKVRPHEGRADAGPDGVTEFVEYGRAMEKLVAGLREVAC
ncbi:sugar phosphate isomerase/epimerase [Kibdelosporangium banguiense]|uniref:Sugar phosphate isomerase/epimerase n=1 Tax=Kibdelosporangium banguiense TaxID=1365924 RepID=A0ABS4TT41_9PSEU|nr:sugar phosphate isomerase/epimerase family protein [Kibdelosporangium banguiense]MBP2327159.1 sugar phosphate isomerase/epimerase [Kibdelosporangium banguiense]